MGASHVRALVAEGAKVVFGDILDDEGELVARDVGDDARYVHLDVTRPEDWDAVVAAAVERFGSVDILVNNAGHPEHRTHRGLSAVGMAADHRREPDRRVPRIRAVTPPMKRAGRGSIINISSIEGMAGTSRLPRVHRHEVRGPWV